MRRAGSVQLFAAISLALHLAWVVLLPESQRDTVPETHWVEMTFEAATALPAPAPTESSSSLSAASAAAAANAPTSAQEVWPTLQPTPPDNREQPVAALQQPPKPARKKKEARQPQPAVQLEPAVAAEPAPQLAAAEPETPRPVAPEPLALLPRTAALSLESLARGNALRCGSRAQVGTQQDCAPNDEVTGQTAQAALTRDLDTAAHNIAHLKPREHPVLKRRSDGSYAYDGHVFEAIVRPDGNVEFRDSAIKGELHFSPVPFVFVADLNDVVERHAFDRELYSAEKQWLIDETRELRDKLAADFRRRELLDSNRALERTLRGILDDHALSLTKKHEAVFLLWQDCGEDAQAQAHRRAVNAFVNRYMPKDSALGFAAEELQRLNATRPGLQKFEPYAGT